MCGLTPEVSVTYEVAVEQASVESAPEARPPIPGSCPCGSGKATDACCLPLIRGERQPETAEELMRSRYSAYVLQEVDYILGTHTYGPKEEPDREATARWSQAAEWLGLEVVSTEAGTAADREGVVEFIARYRIESNDYAHHERAVFRRRDDGRWLYAEGEMVKPRPKVREVPKVGRNEPCPCGSGKKYKKCCG
jgi:SEC-C motif-containing protein